MAGQTVVWQDSLWYGRTACGMAGQPVVWQDSLWYGRTACGMAGHPTIKTRRLQVKMEMQLVFVQRKEETEKG
jgi:hypothetical protein